MIYNLQGLLDVIIERARGLLAGDTLPNVIYNEDIQAILSSADNLAKLFPILPNPDRRQPPFLSSYSNDMRGDLNTILGFSRTMSSFPKLYNDQPLNSAQVMAVETISISGKQLLQMVNDLVDYSLIYAGRMELYQHYFDVQNVINCLTKPDPALSNAYTLETETSPDIPKLFGDEIRTQQVLKKIMAAVQKLVQPTRIAVFAHDTSLDEDMRAIHIHIDHPAAELTWDKISALYNPHLALQAKILDLYIAHSLTKLQHGTLFFESISPRHSMFTLSLPMFPPD